MHRTPRTFTAVVACAGVIGAPLASSALLLAYYCYDQSEKLLKITALVSGLLAGVTLTCSWVVWSGSLIDVSPPSLIIATIIALVVG